MITILDAILIFCLVYFFGKGEFANGYVKGAKEENESEVEEAVKFFVDKKRDKFDEITEQ